MNESLLELITTLLPIVEAGALVVARPLGFIMVFPVFGWFGLVGMIRTVTAFVIGFPMLQVAYLDLANTGAPLAAEFIVVLVAKEFIVGAVVGIVLGAPFWAAETAGTYVDVFRGTSSQRLSAPIRCQSR